MSSYTRLRTLTRLSPLNFGKTRKDTVQETLDQGAIGRSRIVWYYFFMSNISFVDEILDELGVTEELRIEKPTTNKRLFEIWESRLSITDEREIQLHVTAKRRSAEWSRKAARKSINSKDRLGFSRSGLQSKNHNH